MSTTIRIGTEAHRLLRELALDRGETMSEALEQLLEEERRRRLPQRANEVYASWRAQPDVWAEVEAERAIWDVTLSDGLPDDDEPRPESSNVSGTNG